MNTYVTLLAGLLLAVVGVALLLVASLNPEWWKTQVGWQAFLSQLGGLLVVTGLISLLWDLVGRRAFADEVLAKAQVGADIRAAGLERVTMRWLEEVPWANLFSHAKEIEIFLSYGRGWRSAQWPNLINFCAKSGRSLRVYLPDPADDTTMAVLAQRYASDPEKIREQVRDAGQEFMKLKPVKRGQADVRIYHRAGDPTFACYRFDDQSVVTMYSHRRERGAVPAFIFGPGTLHDFIRRELIDIRAQSQEQGLGKDASK